MKEFLTREVTKGEMIRGLVLVTLIGALIMVLVARGTEITMQTSWFWVGFDLVWAGLLSLLGCWLNEG